MSVLLILQELNNVLKGKLGMLKVSVKTLAVVLENVAKVRQRTQRQVSVKTTATVVVMAMAMVMVMAMVLAQDLVVA